VAALVGEASMRKLQSGAEGRCRATGRSAATGGPPRRLWLLLCEV